MSDENLPYDLTHPVYEAGTFVLVPAEGDFLVQNGKVVEAVEVDGDVLDDEITQYSVYVRTEDDENG